MNLTKLTNHIYLVQFRTTLQMCRALLRFEEHAENPHFKDKVFTKKEIYSWYKKHQDKDVRKNFADGFCLNGKAINSLKNWKLDRYETALIKLFDGTRLTKNTVVIFIANNSEKLTFKHEYCHALYYTNKIYKSRVNKTLKQFLKKNRAIFAILRKFYHDVGYVNKNNFLDEINAFIVEDPKYFQTEYGINLEDIYLDLNTLYEQYKV